MGIRILSGGGRHEFIDASHRNLVQLEKTVETVYDVTPMVCLHCGTIGWREKYSGRLKLLEYTGGPDQVILRPLNDEEKGCEYMIVKKIMET